MSEPALTVVVWDGGLDIEAALEPRARVFFDALQDRHVPITPRLARALVLFERARDPSTVMPWGRAYDLAGQALGLGGSFGRTEFWATLTPVFVMEIAEPLLRKAAVACGEVMVAVPGAARDSAEFDGKCRSIEQALERLLQHPQAAGLGFWSRAGVAMLAAYEDRVLASAGATTRSALGPQRVNGVLPGLVFELEPLRAPAMPPTRRKVRPTVRSERLRAGTRPREGGVDGIAHTTRLDEVDTALATTFAYPSDLLVLKLMEEGFLTTLRPPFRNPSRDLLAMVLADGRLAPGPLALVKAAWIDASVRLRLILAGMGRARSEMGWCDLTGTGPVCSACSAQDQDARVALDGWALEGPVRRSLVARSTLTPAGFAARPLRSWRQADTADRSGEAVQSLMAEVGRVALAPHTGTKARNPRPTAGAPPRPGDYGVVLVMDIASGQEGTAQRVTDWPSDRAAILRRFDLGRVNRVRAAQILLPSELAPNAVFRMASDAEPSEAAAQADPDQIGNDALKSLLGQISDWLVNQTLRAFDD